MNDDKMFGAYTAHVRAKNADIAALLARIATLKTQLADGRYQIQRLFEACGDGTGSLDSGWVIVVATKALEALSIAAAKEKGVK